MVFLWPALKYLFNYHFAWPKHKWRAVDRCKTSGSKLAPKSPHWHQICRRQFVSAIDELRNPLLLPICAESPFS